MFLHYLYLPALIKGQPKSSLHGFTATSIEGKTIDFSSFEGKKILIVNTASECGLTPQFKQLQQLYDDFKDRNLIIVGFPSNDFGQQEPGNDLEIKSFCERNYGVSFLMMAKIHVKGSNIHPIYKWLTSKSENGVMSSSVKWNFQKYLIDEKGHLVDMVIPWRRPDCRKIIRWLNKASDTNKKT